MGLILSPVLGILKAIPIWAYVIVACLAWGGWQRHRATSVQQEFQQAQAEAAAAREVALKESIEETSRRLAAQQKVVKNADVQLTQVRAQAASAADAVSRLRTRLAAVGPGASAPDSALAGTSEAERLANILGRCADRYRSVAEVADRAIVTGLACEASYSSLTK